MLRVLPSLQFGHTILSGPSSPPSATIQTVAPPECEEAAPEKTESLSATAEELTATQQNSRAASDDSIARDSSVARNTIETEPQSPKASAVPSSRLRGIQMSPSDKDLLLEGYLAQSVAALCLDDMPEEGEGEGEDKGEMPGLSLRVHVRQSKALLTQSLLLTPAYGGSSVWAPLNATEEEGAGDKRQLHDKGASATEQEIRSKDGKQGNDTEAAAGSSPNSPHSTCSSSCSSSSASFAASSPSSEFFSLSSSSSFSGSSSPLCVLSPRRHHSEETEAAYAAWNPRLAKDMEMEARDEAPTQAQAAEEREVGKWDLTMLPDDLLEGDDVLLVQQQGEEQQGQEQGEHDCAASACSQEQQQGASSNPPLLPLPYPLPQAAPSSLNNSNGSRPGFYSPQVVCSPPIGLICRMNPQQQLWALQQHMLAVAAAAGLVPAATVMGMGMGMGAGMGMGMCTNPMGYAQPTMPPCMTAYQQPAVPSFQPQQQQPQQVCVPMEQQQQQEEEEALPFKGPMVPGMRSYNAPQYLPAHALASGTGVFLPRS